VSFHGSTRASSSGLGTSTGNAGPLAPNVSGNSPENNHARYSYQQTEPFDFTPIFIPNNDLGDLNPHSDDYLTFTNLTNMNILPTTHDFSMHANSAEMDLGALLAYHLPMQQQPHTQVWSNQTTPDLNSGAQESPSTNPITSAIDQSMVNIGMPPAPITISPGQSSWDGLNYAPFGSLPPLYGTGSGASFVEPEPAVSDVGPQLLALQGSLSTTTVDITRQLQKQPSIDAQIVRKQIFYYFNRVRKMQYWFAGESTKDVLRDIVVSNPSLPLPRRYSMWRSLLVPPGTVSQLRHSMPLILL
jgi:hypothetical protein